MFSASFRESSNQGTVRAVFSLPLFTGKRNFIFGRRIHLPSCRDTLFPSLRQLADGTLANFAPRLWQRLVRYGIPVDDSLRRRKRWIDQESIGNERPEKGRMQDSESSGRSVAVEGREGSGIGRVTNGRFTASIIHRHKIW